MRFDYTTITLTFLDREDLRTSPAAQQRIENEIHAESLERLNSLDQEGFELVNLTPTALQFADTTDVGVYRATLRRVRH